jgi:protein-tyrosine phosphatase
LLEARLIDLHNHILPGVDDGAADLDESIAIARQFVSEGVVRVAATPHFDPERRSGIDAKGVEEKVVEVRKSLESARVQLEVAVGHELFLTPEAPSLLEAGRVSPLGLGSAVLVELSLMSQQPPLYLDQTLFQLQLAGYQPVLAHPERYPFVQRDPAALNAVVAREVVLQLTAPSLLGEYGWRIRRTAERLLRQGSYTVAASDRHHPGRNRSLADLHRRIAELRDIEVADLLLRSNPQRLLNGERVDKVEAAPLDSSGRLSRLFRR